VVATALCLPFFDSEYREMARDVGKVGFYPFDFYSANFMLIHLVDSVVSLLGLIAVVAFIRKIRWARIFLVVNLIIAIVWIALVEASLLLMIHNVAAHNYYRRNPFPEGLGFTSGVLAGVSILFLIWFIVRVVSYSHGKDSPGDGTETGNHQGLQAYEGAKTRYGWLGKRSMFFLSFLFIGGVILVLLPLRRGIVPHSIADGNELFLPLVILVATICMATERSGLRLWQRALFVFCIFLGQILFVNLLLLAEKHAHSVLMARTKIPSNDAKLLITRTSFFISYFLSCVVCMWRSRLFVAPAGDQGGIKERKSKGINS
jgi:hypothetical protein